MSVRELMSQMGVITLSLCVLKASMFFQDKKLLWFWVLILFLDTQSSKKKEENS